MADTSKVKPQILIVYYGPDGVLRGNPYSVAYDEDHAEELIEQCEEKFGHESYPQMALQG